MTRNNTRQSWASLKPFLPRRSRSRIAGIGMASFLGGLAESGVLVLITLIADSLVRSSDAISVAGTSLAPRSGVLAALLLVVTRVALTLATASTTARFAAQVMESAQRQLVSGYLSSSHSVRAGRARGDLGTVAVNHARLTGDLASSYAVMAASACGLAAFGGMSLFINPLASLGIAFVGGIVLLVMRPLRVQSHNAAAALAESARTIGREVSETESLHREIELFQVGPQFSERINSEIDRGGQYMKRLRFLGIAVPQLFQTALIAAAVLSLLLIVGRVSGAQLAAVGAVVLLLIRSMSSAQQLITANQRVIEYTSYASGVRETLSTFESDPKTFGAARPKKLTPLRLQDVGFTYDGREQVLSSLDVELSEGELVGIVGPSGAGKSTLVELLLRLRAPTTGLITADRTNLSAIDPGEFARRVAFVPQQAVMISGTIAENVDLFRGLPEESLVAAIEQAHLSTEVESFPDHIHTKLGPSGRTLSGGQLQRLTIARALAGDPEILVLDEPTSALDAVSERAIRDALSELPAGRIVVIVAHRYSTLRSCTRILVLRDGRIEMDATPDEVARSSSFFKTMVASDS